MPWKRKGKCVFKITKSGKQGKKQGCSKTAEKAKKYIKALYASEDSVAESIKKQNFILDIVNEVVGSLPIGHKNRNSTFAKQILRKVYEELRQNDLLSYDEILKFTKKVSGDMELL